MELAVSTHHAAQLLHVHESSVKRWCNAKELACRYTPGGHRRISLEALLQVARRQDLPCRLLDLRPFEKDVWRGVGRVWSEDRYEELVVLLYAWLQAGEQHRPVTLLRFLLEMDFPLAALFDRLVTPALHRIGLAWHAGSLTVGEEHRMTEILRDSLYRLLFDLDRAGADGSEARGTAVVGCGRTEDHDLGALMVRLLLAASGWRVVYLGRCVPPEDLAGQQARCGASLICVSFASPQARPDALALVHLLGSLYDDTRPYRLALGGSALQGGFGPSKKPAPFLDMQCFEDTATFSVWMSAFEA